MNRGAIEKNKGRCHELLILAFVHLSGINLISKSLRKDPGEFVLASPAHTFLEICICIYMYIILLLDEVYTIISIQLLVCLRIFLHQYVIFSGNLC